MGCRWLLSASEFSLSDVWPHKLHSGPGHMHPHEKLSALRSLLRPHFVAVLPEYFFSIFLVHIVCLFSPKLSKWKSAASWLKVWSGMHWITNVFSLWRAEESLIILVLSSWLWMPKAFVIFWTWLSARGGYTLVPNYTILFLQMAMAIIRNQTLLLFWGPRRKIS